MEGTAMLILNKLEELIVAVGGKIEAFYPYVVRQVIVEGVLYLVGLLMSIVVLLSGIHLGNKSEWDGDSFQGNAGFVLIFIGGFATLFSSIMTLSLGLSRMINPHYYAVQRILEIGQGLLK